MDSDNIPGIKKAAVLLLTMDEEISKEIIKDLSEEEIEALGKGDVPALHFHTLKVW